MSGFDQSSIAVSMPTVVGADAALGGPYKIKPSEAFSGALMTVSGLTGETISVQTSPDGYQGAPANPSFYRTDWQGTSLLYLSARTNVCFNTEAFNLWSLGTIPPTVTPNTTTAPDGTLTADTILFNASGAVNGVNDAAPSVRLNAKRVLSCWLKGAVGGEQIRFSDGWGASVTFILTTSWVRYSHAFVTQTSGYFSIFAVSGTPTIYAWGAQAENSVNVATPYFPNPNSSPTTATITDYTLSNGVITLAEVPATGATLSYDNSILPSPYYIFATGDGVRTQFAYDGVWGTLSANSGKGNGIWQIDLRGAQSYQLVKSAGAETATVNMTLKRDALQYTNTAGTWSVT